MYNESINTNNKIISTELISNIFSRMNEIIKSYTSKANREEQTYNSLPFESRYKDDKHSYINSSEVIIEKNIDNLANRNKIKSLYYDKKKYIKFELIAIVVITLIILLIQTIK